MSEYVFHINLHVPTSSKDGITQIVFCTISKISIYFCLMFLSQALVVLFLCMKVHKNDN